MAATMFGTADSGPAPDARPATGIPMVEPDDEESLSAGDPFGPDDDHLRALLDREALRPLLEALTLREKQILVMRFHRAMTQSEIGLELEVSQMQVSRLLTAILGKLRAQGTP